MKTTLLFVLGAFLLASCDTPPFDKYFPNPPAQDPATLEEVASSPNQWTGVTASQENRIFLNYPNWSPAPTPAVVELLAGNQLTPYPNEEWNTWDSTLAPQDHFVCVQSVFVDDDNYLWVLDPANPQRNGQYLGVVEGGAKLVKIDLASNEVIDKIIFSAPVIVPNSYLNDVRIDTEEQYAYITDSNEGALVVVNLATKEARRLLDDHFSTAPEHPLVIDGEVWRTPQGEVSLVASDGIALSPDRTTLYYHALTGSSLYSIATATLRDASLTDAQVAAEVQYLDQTGATDGMLYGEDGSIYHSNMEEYAITRYTPEGVLETVVQDSALKWPDTFYWAPDGDIYVTTSQIHIPNPTEPYKLFKINLK